MQEEIKVGNVVIFKYRITEKDMSRKDGEVRTMLKTSQGIVEDIVDSAVHGKKYVIGSGYYVQAEEIISYKIILE